MLFHSRPRMRCGLLTVTTLLLVAFLSFRGTAEDYRSPSDGIQLMRYEEGLLTLEARDASLERVLTELSRMAMITIVSDGPVEGRISVYADRLPLDKALRKILRGKDTTLIYAAQDEITPTRYTVKEVRIYVAEADKGEGRRYSYDSSKEDASHRPHRVGSRRSLPNSSQPRSPTAPASPPVPEVESNPDTKRLFTELMEGNLDELEDIAERLKEANPQVAEQIDQFLDTLENARMRAEETGRPMEGLGHLQMLMQQILRKGEMSPEEEEEQ